MDSRLIVHNINCRKYVAMFGSNNTTKGISSSSASASTARLPPWHTFLSLPQKGISAGCRQKKSTRQLGCQKNASSHKSTL